MLKQFFTSPTHPPIEVTQRNIIIFHCEFSSKRGPDMLVIYKEVGGARVTRPHLFIPSVLFSGVDI